MVHYYEMKNTRKGKAAKTTTKESKRDREKKHSSGNSQ